MNRHVPRKQQSMAVFSLSEDRPKISETAFIAPNATVIGQVLLGDGVSVWPSAVIRGDEDLITIEDRSNVQDGAVIHVDRGHPMSIGKDVIVGHAAVLQGRTIGELVLDATVSAVDQRLELSRASRSSELTKTA